MKRFIITSIAISLTLLFIGCSDEDNPRTCDCKQLFKGTSKFIAEIDSGLTTVLDDGRILITNQKAEWYDSTNVKLLTGKSFWTVNWLKETDGNAEMWATAEIVVDSGLGKWELSWSGTRVPTDSGSFVEMQSPFRVEGDAVGKGVEGEVLGMEAKWTYTMDFNGDLSTLFYNSEGYILK